MPERMFHCWKGEGQEKAIAFPAVGILVVGVNRFIGYVESKMQTLIGPAEVQDR